MEFTTRPVHGGNLAWAAALAGCSPDQLLDFSASINPLGPPQSAIAAIVAHLKDLSHYPDPDYLELRSRLAQSHAVAADWVLPGNGAAELLSWAGRDCSNLQAVYLPVPAFSDYRRSLRAASVPVIDCPLVIKDKWPEAALVTCLSDAIEQGPAAQNCALLLNNPHNPTGWLFSQATLRPYLNSFGLVIVDEAFMDFLPPAQQQSLIAQVKDFPNLVILRSLTKFYSLPGLRLGYAIAHPERLRRWQQWRDPWPVNTLAVAATLAVLDDREFQNKTWQWLEPTRSQLLSCLNQISYLQPLAGCANFLLVACDRSVTELQQQLLQRHRLLIRDCLSFESLGDRYFRVAVRSAADNCRLITALAEGHKSNSL
ncbi:MAG: threonine-phosphate decarboxylase [Leptolyngbyaceae cyanobacterium RM1_1_2]|nr:threonine-phosphate decarboxylase [Leptolyngbyaceae cyanobacterium RM1_1_2]